MKKIIWIPIVLAIIFLLFATGILSWIWELPTGVKYCNDAPNEPNCYCLDGEVKVSDEYPIPGFPPAYACKPEDAVDNYIWRLVENTSGALFCAKTTIDNPFVTTFYNTNAECLNAIVQRIGGNGCPLELILDSSGRTQLVAYPIGAKVVCNEERHFHVCSQGFVWIVDEDSAVVTSGHSYCPATK